MKGVQFHGRIPNKILIILNFQLLNLKYTDRQQKMIRVR